MRASFRIGKQYHCAVAGLSPEFTANHAIYELTECEGAEGAGGVTGMPGLGRALRSSVLETAVNRVCCLSRLCRSFVSDSTRYPLDGCNDPGVVLDTVAV